MDKLKNYKEFIKVFKEKKYNFIFFDELDLNKNYQLINRHDIDLDCDLAMNMAEEEKKLGIKSTYFFLLRNHSYNLLSDKNIKIIKTIQKYGHKVSLHFDPTIYDDINDGLKFEIKILENIIEETIDIISLHRPIQEHIGDNDYIDFPHTYQDLYMKDVKYFADSRGSFRFGHPYESDEFNNNKNIQLCTHPFWWFVDYNNRNECINKVYTKKCNSMDNHFKNSLVFYKGK